MESQKVKFSLVLRNIDKNNYGYVNVMLSFYEGSKRKQKFFNSELRLNKQYWAKQRIKKSVLHDSKKLNEIIDSFYLKKRIEIEDLINNNGGVISLEIINRHYNRNNTNNNLITLLTEFNEGLTSESKKRHFKTLLGSLEAFTCGKVIEPTEFSKKSFIQSYIDYLECNNLNNNTIHKMINHYKQLLRYCYVAGIIESKDYVNEVPKLRVIDNTIIVVSKIELQKIIDFKTTNKSLYRTRVLFLIQSFTGLRVSDLLKLTKENINGDQIEILTKKTGKMVYIPITSILIKLFEEIDYNFEYLKISDVQYNLYLKKLFAACELNRIIELRQKKGGKIEITKKKLSEVITSHIARKTFITIGLVAGIPATTIQSIVGHSKIEMISKYMNISDKIKKEEMKKIDQYFSS